MPACLPARVRVCPRKVEYENALTMAANGNMEEASMLPLCHTCHIVRPLRSKHCSVQKRCVSCFDHFCPYVNNTMGSRNYKYFILFMAFGLVGVSMTAIACVQYLMLVGRHKWIIFQLCDYLVRANPTVALALALALALASLALVLAALAALARALV